MSQIEMIHVDNIHFALLTVITEDNNIKQFVEAAGFYKALLNNQDASLANLSRTINAMDAEATSEGRPKVAATPKVFDNLQHHHAKSALTIFGAMFFVMRFDHKSILLHIRGQLGTVFLEKFQGSEEDKAELEDIGYTLSDEYQLPPIELQVYVNHQETTVEIDTVQYEDEPYVSLMQAYSAYSGIQSRSRIRSAIAKKSKQKQDLLHSMTRMCFFYSESCQETEGIPLKWLDFFKRHIVGKHSG